MPLRRPPRLPPLALVGLLVLASTALRFAVAVQVRTPLLYPDEYLHSALARSLVDGTFPQIRGGSVPFFSYLAPVLMAPAWIIDDVDVAYRVAQFLGCVAFSAAAFPAYLLARRIGVSANGGVVVAAFTLLISNGVWTTGLLAEPYAYPLLLLGVLAGVEAIAVPTVWRQLAVVASIAVLPLVAGTQFFVFGAAYLLASVVCSPRSVRAYVRRQPVVVGALAAFAVAVVVAVVAGGRVSENYQTATRFDYPLSGTAAWFGAYLFVLAIGSGWVVVPGAVLGFSSLARSDDAMRRAFAFLSLFLIAGQVFEGALFGVNGDELVERYAFYGSALVVIAFVWAGESVRLRRRAFSLVAYAMAVAALFLPVMPPLLGARIYQSPTIFGLGESAVAGLAGEQVWGPVLAIVAAIAGWRGARRVAAVTAVGAAICFLTTVGASRNVVEAAGAGEIPRARASPGAAFVTSSNSPLVGLMETLFWNRDITRVLLVGPGNAPDGYPSVRVRLTPDGGFATRDGEDVAGPFVFGPDAAVVTRGGRAARRARLVTATKVPSVLIFGWDPRTRRLAPGGRIFAARDGRLRGVTLRLQSIDRGIRTMRFLCRRGFKRTVEVGETPIAVSIPLPRRVAQACRFELATGSFRFVRGRPASVKADLVLNRSRP